MIEDKVTSLKEELEELIEEVKNEVDDRGSELASNRELQSQSFNKLDKSMDKLRKELKQFADKERRSSEQAQRDLRMKLLTQIEGIDENLNQVKEDIKSLEAK